MTELLCKVLFFLSMLVFSANVTSINSVIIIVTCYVLCAFSYFYFNNIRGFIDNLTNYFSVNNKPTVINSTQHQNYFINRKYNKLNVNNSISELKDSDVPSPILKSPWSKNGSGGCRPRERQKTCDVSTMSRDEYKTPKSIDGRRFGSIDLATYMNVKSPGFTSRVVEKATESASYHVKYPAVKHVLPYRFDRSTLRDVSKLPKVNSMQPVRIAPPDSTSIILNDKNTTENSGAETKSTFLQALKEISRKRNYTQEENEKSGATPKKSRKNEVKVSVTSPQYKRAHEDCSNESLDEESNRKKRCENPDRNVAKMMSYTSSMSVIAPSFDWEATTKKRKSSKTDKSQNDSLEKSVKQRKMASVNEISDVNDKSDKENRPQEEVKDVPLVNGKVEKSPPHSATTSKPESDIKLDVESLVCVDGGRILNRSNRRVSARIELPTRRDPTKPYSDPEAIAHAICEEDGIDEQSLKKRLLDGLMNSISSVGERSDSVVYYQNSVLQEIGKNTSTVEAQPTSAAILTSSSFNPLLPPKNNAVLKAVSSDAEKVNKLASINEAASDAGKETVDAPKIAVGAESASLNPNVKDQSASTSVSQPQFQFGVVSLSTNPNPVSSPKFTFGSVDQSLKPVATVTSEKPLVSSSVTLTSASNNFSSQTPSTESITAITSATPVTKPAEENSLTVESKTSDESKADNASSEADTTQSESKTFSFGQTANKPTFQSSFGNNNKSAFTFGTNTDTKNQNAKPSDGNGFKNVTFPNTLSTMEAFNLPACRTALGAIKSAGTSSADQNGQSDTLSCSNTLTSDDTNIKNVTVPNSNPLSSNLSSEKDKGTSMFATTTAPSTAVATQSPTSLFATTTAAPSTTTATQSPTKPSFTFGSNSSSVFNTSSSLKLPILGSTTSPIFKTNSQPSTVTTDSTKQTLNTQSIMVFGQASQATSTFGSNSQSVAPAFGSTVSTKATPTFGSTTSTQATPTFGSTTTTQATPTFGLGSQPVTTFGSSSQQAPTFGSNSQQTSTFGSDSQQTSTFGPSSQPSMTFGLGTQQPLFSSNPQTPTFGTSQASIFGSTAQQNTQHSTNSPSQTFGGNTQQSTSNSNTQPMTFGANAQQPQQSVFGANTSQSSQGSNSQPAPFGSNTQQTTFGSNTQSSSIFGSGVQQQTSTFGSGNQSVFGDKSSQPAFGMNSNQQTAFGSTSAPQSTPFGTSSNQQTSTFGSSTTFGAASTQPSVFGSSIPSTFGSNTSSTFGSNTPTTFGAGSTTPMFGSSSQPTQFGTPSTGQSVFKFGSTEQSSTPTQPPAFGSSTATNVPSFGASNTSFGGSFNFSNPNTNTNNTNTFGSNTFGAAALTPISNQPAQPVFQFGTPAAAPAATASVFAFGANKAPAPVNPGGSSMFSIGSGGSSGSRSRNMRTRRIK